MEVMNINRRTLAYGFCGSKFDRFGDGVEKSQTLSGISEIRQAVSVEFSTLQGFSKISETLSRKLADTLTLRWSHYVAIINGALKVESRGF